MIRRLLIVAAVAAVLYYGYDYWVRFTEEANDIRARAGEKKDGPEEVVDPVTATAQRRRAEEQAVKDANKKPDQ
jgi:hypothetical protein